jgi:hypothetical protein
MKLKRGSGTLIEEMKRYLPIPARPTKELSRFLRQKGMHIDMNRDLNIIEVFDSGDMGGILCAIEGKKGQKEALVISLTHLIIKPDHPLSDKIVAYQKKRIKSLQSQSQLKFAE